MEGRRPLFPKIEQGHYMMDALMEIGPFTRSAMGGEEPIGWVEIHSYACATGEISEPWEARTLVNMSRAYLSGRQTGKSPFSIPPLERQGFRGYVNKERKVWA